MPPDYRLIAITAPDLHAGRTVSDAAAAAEAGGATALQLRVKTSSASELLRLAEEILGATTLPLYINDRADVAAIAGAQGVHLGADDVPADRLSAVLPASLRLGLSIGSDSEAALARPAVAHYWSVGPFNRTSTKVDAGPPLGPNGFRLLAAAAPTGCPVIAIGGIAADDVPLVVASGGTGVAVASEIFAASDIERAARRIRRRLDAELD